MKNFIKRLLLKETYRTNIAFYAGLLLLVSPVLNGCSVSRINRLKNKSYKEWKTYQWKEIKRSSDKEVKEWIIYTRRVRESNFLEYRIEGEIESSPLACISAFRKDIHYQAEDNKNKKYPTYEIEEESKDSLLTYVIHNEPFPLKDTEMSVRYTFFSNEDGSTGVSWKEAWDECPVQPSKKLNRIETFRGSWQFLPISSNHNKAVNSIQFDLKGMPLWMAEPMVLKFLKEGLEYIRDSASS